MNQPESVYDFHLNINHTTIQGKSVFGSSIFLILDYLCWYLTSNKPLTKITSSGIPAFQI